MSSEIVWNAFYLHALLLHHHRKNSTLELPHNGKQSDRFTDALKARNNVMVGIGQPQWAHACDDCEQLIAPAPGSPEGTPWRTSHSCNCYYM